ncbi:tRNA lysidine(34) synthetase TilS [Candidatus Saccharibacteria bacterium]|nr:tRNA lysidine(34) synthetase TilS [Candidatus Saccharibacteria bacterium]
MGRLILAVSGGVDSVVMLDKLVREGAFGGGAGVLVAHFNHGIRGEEADGDERFVRGLAEKYELECVVGRAVLGEGVSEAEAREARWRWLDGLRGEGEVVAVAHHLDDLVGSVVINLLRGTGWRGLAVMNRPGVVRPLLEWTKVEVYEYAMAKGLEWVEDGTNSDLHYLRNRLRGRVEGLPIEVKREILDLRSKQAALARLLRLDVDFAYRHGEVASDSRTAVLRDVFGDRARSHLLDDQVLDELLRAWLEENGIRTTRPTRERLLEAIRTYRSGKRFNLPGGRLVVMERDGFRLD